MTLRVCHIIAGDQWAGAEVQAAHLLSGLVRRDGLELSAILFAEGLLAVDLRRSGVAVTVLEERRLGRLGLLAAMPAALRACRPHIVHTHRYKENTLGGLAGRRAGVRRFVRTEHGHTEPFHGLDGLKMAVYEGLDHLFARWGTHTIITVSRDLHSALVRHLPRTRVALIPNGLDPGRVVLSTPPARLRDQLGIGHDAPVFGTAGRLVPVKRLTAFLGAARAVLDKQPEARFLIAGEGPLRADLEEAARKMGIQGAVSFLGFRRDVPDLINLMDVFVLPSLSEGRPMVLLEAMTLGKPIVASAVGGIPELLAAWPAASLVPPGDERALTEACLHALSVARSPSAPGRDPSTLLEAHRAYVRMCDQTHALYQGLIERKDT